MFRRQRMVTSLGWTRTNTTTRPHKTPILYLAHILPNEASSWWGRSCAAPGSSPSTFWRCVGGGRAGAGLPGRCNKMTMTWNWRGWTACRRPPRESLWVVLARAMPPPWADWRRCGWRMAVQCRQFDLINCMCKCVCMFVIFLRLSHSSFQLRLALYQRVVSVAERLANLIVVPCRPHWYQSDNTGWHLDFFLIGRYNSTVSEAAEIPVLSALTRRWPKSRSCPWLTGVRHSLLCHITCLRFRTDVWIVWCLRTMT